MKKIKSKYFIWFSILLFVMAILLPLLSLLPEALYADGKFTFENFRNIFQSEVLGSIFNSIFISLLVSIISVVLGCLFAFLFAKTNLPFKSVFRLLFVLPLLIPSYIVAVAWMDAWRFLNVPANLSYSLPAVVFILVSIYTPLAIFIIEGSLKNISASIEEAGEMFGSYKTVLLKVILPLLRPALFSSFILIFIITISEFSIPSYLSVQTFTSEIFTQFTAFYNYPTAFAHSILLTLISLLIVFPERFYLSSAPFVSFGKKTFSLKLSELKNKPLWSLVCCAYAFLFVLIPFAMLTQQAFSTNNSILQQVMQISPAFGDSILLSVLAALLITIFGFAFAILSVKYNIRISDYLPLVTFSVPAIVTGIALTRFYNTPLLNFIYATSLIVLIAYVARFVFISQKILASGLRQIPSSFNEVSLLMGASTFYTFRKITFPLLAESFFISFFITLILCLGELITVMMVYPPGISLLPVRIFTLMANAPQNIVSGMCLASLLFTLIIISIMFTGKNLLFRRQWAKAQS